ncbi:MAG TPA: hypothetical protein VFJ96_00680 [Gemmatimonadaceae bacterium]|nr:hypothetical protein [Gemmatimonadaceae bacterium]
MPSSPALPPYTVARIHFPFRSLAAQAARARLGGEREVVLACLMAARLAAAALPDHALPVEARATRARPARTWFASLALPDAVQTAAERLVAASARDARGEMATALRGVATVAGRYLDAGSKRELEQLIKALKD